MDPVRDSIRSQEVLKRHRLTRLLSPVEPTEFLDRYWENEPCLITRDDPSYFAELFTIEDLDRLLTTRGWVSEFGNLRVLRAEGSKIKRAQIPRCDGGMPDVFAVHRAYNDGYSLILSDLSAAWASVADLCRSLSAELELEIGANLYLTPPNAQGFLPHRDPHDVLILQISGSKKWQIFDPGTALPAHDPTSRPELDSLGKPRSTLWLTPGSLLYIPRGYVHKAETAGETSTHLTLGLYPEQIVAS